MLCWRSLTVIVVVFSSADAQERLGKKSKKPRPIDTPLSPPPAPGLVTQALVLDLEAAIAFFFGLEASYDEYCEPCVKGDNMGALVRLGFHDAAGGGGRVNG